MGLEAFTLRPVLELPRQLAPKSVSLRWSANLKSRDSLCFRLG